MKRKVLYIILGTEAVLLCLLYILADFMPQVISNVMAFPFEPMGMLLRSLSLLGGIANGVALLLWAGISLLPVVPVLKNWKDKEKRAEHVLLVVLSVLLFVVLYYMINPGLLYDRIPAGMADIIAGGNAEILSIIKAVLCMAVWSVVVCYVVFQLLRLFKNSEKEQLFIYLRRLLYALCALFVGALVFTCVGELITGLQAAQRAADGAMAVFRFLVAALPYAMDVLVTLFALKLLDELLADSHSEEVVVAAQRLSKLCCLTLALVTASGVALNILQLIFSKAISNVNVYVDIPVMSLVFVLAAFLCSRLIEENKQLADENEMFV